MLRLQKIREFDDFRKYTSIYSSGVGDIPTRLSEEDFAHRWATASTKGASSNQRSEYSGLCMLLYMWIGVKLCFVYENSSCGDKKGYMADSEGKGETVVACHPVLLGPGDQL
jgi:hypothetical protein